MTAVPVDRPSGTMKTMAATFSTTAQAERPLSGQLMSTQGPLARRVGDVRLALAAMAQRDIRDPWWMPVPLEGPAQARPIRVALSADALGHGVHPAVKDAVRAPFVESEWDLATMEPLSGLYPAQTAPRAQEHLSVRDAQMRGQ